MKIRGKGIKSIHELLTIQLGPNPGPTQEMVDIAKLENGELLSVTVGSTEITPEIWEILLFLKKEGKL